MSAARALPSPGLVTPSRRAAPRIALAVLMVLTLAAVTAPLIAPYAFDAVDLGARREGPSPQHWFGTDELGRDVLTRVIFGARVSLLIGLLSALLSVLLGACVGAVAGFVRGAVDSVAMRLTDAMLSIPRLPFLMILGAIVRPGVLGLALLVSLCGWMETARVVRAETMSLARRGFVEAGSALGTHRWRLLLRHVLPNLVPLLATSVTLAVGRGILIESALSFFGVGVQPPAASWGNMLYQAQTALLTEPWLALFPGLAIFVTVLCVNVIGDGIE